MNIDDLTLGQIKEIQSLVGGSCSPSRALDHGAKICVMDRGFVYVGCVKTDDKWCYVTKAQNIRYWGTSRGLGELKNGPLSGTKLDPVGDIKAPMRSLIFLMDVEATKWNL